LNAGEIIFDMETRLLSNMIRLLERGSFSSASWQARKLAALGTLKTINAKVIAEDIPAVIEAAKAEIAARGKDTAVRIDEGVTGGLLADALPPEADPTLARVWQTWQGKAQDQLATIGTTLLDASQTMYIEAVYKASAEVLAGSKTTREAIRETAAAWSANGIPALIDNAGRTWTPEAYASLVVRGNVRETVNATQDARFNQFDIDLVLVSSHVGSRPEHVPFQGRVYSRSGTNPDYPALSDTGYGTGEGIGGYNCAHELYAYTPGMEKSYQPYPVKESEEAYKASQKQRYLERQIRKAKRDETLLKTPEARQKVKNAQARMRAFIDESGRTRRPDREQIGKAEVQAPIIKQSFAPIVIKTQSKDVEKEVRVGPVNIGLDPVKVKNVKIPKALEKKIRETGGLYSPIYRKWIIENWV